MDLNDMKERMLTGKLYLPNDESIMNEQALCLEKQYDFNATTINVVCIPARKISGRPLM